MIILNKKCALFLTIQLLMSVSNKCGDTNKNCSSGLSEKIIPSKDIIKEQNPDITKKTINPTKINITLHLTKEQLAQLNEQARANAYTGLEELEEQLAQLNEHLTGTFSNKG